MYCTLSMKVKPKTLSRHNQKTDTTAQPEKSSFQYMHSKCIYGYLHGVICPSSVPSKCLFLCAIVYSTLRMEVKPKTISRHNQKLTQRHNQKKYLKPTRVSIYLCLLAGNLIMSWKFIWKTNVGINLHGWTDRRTDRQTRLSFFRYKPIGAAPWRQCFFCTYDVMYSICCMIHMFSYCLLSTLYTW